MANPYIIDDQSNTSTFFDVEGTPKSHTQKYEEINRPGVDGVAYLRTGSKPNDSNLMFKAAYATAQDRQNAINYLHTLPLRNVNYYDQYGVNYYLMIVDLNITRKWQVFNPIGAGGYWLEFDLTVRGVGGSW